MINQSGQKGDAEFEDSRKGNKNMHVAYSRERSEHMYEPHGSEQSKPLRAPCGEILVFNFLVNIFCEQNIMMLFETKLLKCLCVLEVAIT